MVFVRTKDPRESATTAVHWQARKGDDSSIRSLIVISGDCHSRCTLAYSITADCPVVVSATELVIAVRMWYGSIGTGLALRIGAEKRPKG
jgi:hypothetical protein